MKKYFKTISAMFLVLTLISASLNMYIVNAENTESTTAPYKTHFSETFDKQEDVNASIEDSFPGVSKYSNADWALIDGRFGKGLKFTKANDDTEHLNALFTLDTPITLEEAVENNLIVEVSFDFYSKNINPNGYRTNLFFLSEDTTDKNDNVNIYIKGNGTINVTANSIRLKNGNPADIVEFHNFKLAMYAKADENNVKGWYLKSFCYDGKDTGTYTPDIYIGKEAFNNIYLHYSKQAEYPNAELGFDNILVTSYSATNYAVSPVPYRHSYMDSVLAYREIVEKYNTGSMKTAYNNAVELFYKDGVTQGELDAAKLAIDAVASNYEKYEEYVKKLSIIADDSDVQTALNTAKDAIDNGNETAINNAFNTLDSLLSKLPVVHVDYKFDTAEETRNVAYNANRYVYDGTTFANNYAYGGTYYWDYDYNDVYTDNGNGTVTKSQKGKETKIKFGDGSIDMTSLPANSYIETVMDIKYNINAESTIVLCLNNDNSTNTNKHITRFNIGNTKFNSIGDTDGGYYVYANDNKMHRVKITIQVKDASGNAVSKVVGLNVDGNEAPVSNIHEVEIPGNATEYTSISFLHKYAGNYNAVSPNLEDYSAFWLGNLSVTSYTTSAGESVLGDKYKLSKKINSISLIRYSDLVDEKVKAEIDSVMTDVMKVYNNPAVSNDEVGEAEAIIDPIITQEVKRNFENTVNSTYGLDNIKSNIDAMSGGFISELTDMVYDVNWSTSNPDILTGDGVVSRPKINEKITITASVSSGESGDGFVSEFQGKVMAGGTEAQLPISGSMLAYTDVDTAAQSDISVTATGINETVTVPAGQSEIQLYVNTNSGKYAIFVNGEKVKQNTLTASEITSVQINNADVNIIKPDNDNLLKFTGITFRKDGSNREYTKLLQDQKIWSVSYLNNNVFDEDVYVVVASYSNDGKKLFDVKGPIKLAATELNKSIKLTDVNCLIPDDISDVAIKVFAFSSMQTLIPVAEAFNYEQNTNTSVGSTIYIAGDSTAQTYEKAKFPQEGWGAVLDDYLVDGIKVVNCAAGGQSAKSFYYSDKNPRSYSYIEKNIVKGDYLLIQFGHNDQGRVNDPSVYSDVDEYKEYLNKYIDMAQDAEATPIILTSIVRRSEVDTDNVQLEAYRIAAREVAAQREIDCIDAGVDTRSLVHDLGKDSAAKYLYLFVDENDVRFRDSEYWPSSVYNREGGVTDSTHLTYYGANVYAMLVARQFTELDSTQAISAYVDPNKILDDVSLREKIISDYNSYIALKNAESAE